VGEKEADTKRGSEDGIGKCPRDKETVGSWLVLFACFTQKSDLKLWRMMEQCSSGLSPQLFSVKLSCTRVVEVCRVAHTISPPAVFLLREPSNATKMLGRNAGGQVPRAQPQNTRTFTAHT
jgi:hypothetical protein